MTFAEYLVVLQRRWRVWGTGLLLGILAAGVLTALAPVKYTAVATSFVTVAGQGDSGSGSIFQDSQFAVQRMSSYTELTSSPAVLEPVISHLNLPYAARDLKKMVSAISPPNTVLLKLSVTARSAEQAAEIANAISQELGKHIQDLETPQGKSVSNVKVSLTQPAVVPVSPSSPRKPLNLVLGVVAGFGLGLVAAIGRHHLDRRIKTAEDVRSLTGMSPLGSTLRERDARKRPLVALDWRSASAERFRTVRTGLKFASVDKDLHHFVISSAVSGDGKTTAACNLAISWAQTGAAVCLVEGDLRRPAVSRLLGVEGNIGLSDVLVGEAGLGDVLIPWNNNRFTVLPAGSLPPDPAALLGSDAMHALVADLRNRFDVVIYDSPPILSVTDAAVLAHAVDGLVLVVRWGVTTREQLATCVETLRGARLPLLGTILTAVRFRGKALQSSYYSAGGEDRAELPLPVLDLASAHGMNPVPITKADLPTRPRAATTRALNAEPERTNPARPGPTAPAKGRGGR